MAYYNLPVASPQSSENAQPGVHYVDIHFRGGNGLRHQSVQMGDSNPLDDPIGRLSLEALELADAQADDRWNIAPSFSRLVGMTVYRTAIHEAESGSGNADHVFVAEKLASLGFVKKSGVYVSATYIRDARISLYGVASMRAAGKIRYTQHLGVAPGEAAEHPVRFATPAISSRGKDSDSWIALRPKTNSRTKQRNSFLERLVTLEELNDTRR